MVDVIIGYKALSAVVGLPAGKLKTMRHFGSLPLVLHPHIADVGRESGYTTSYLTPVRS